MREKEKFQQGGLAVWPVAEGKSRVWCLEKFKPGSGSVLLAENERKWGKISCGFLRKMKAAATVLFQFWERKGEDENATAGDR